MLLTSVPYKKDSRRCIKGKTLKDNVKPKQKPPLIIKPDKVIFIKEEKLQQ